VCTFWHQKVWVQLCTFRLPLQRLTMPDDITERQYRGREPGGKGGGGGGHIFAPLQSCLDQPLHSLLGSQAEHQLPPCLEDCATVPNFHGASQASPVCFPANLFLAQKTAQIPVRQGVRMIPCSYQTCDEEVCYRGHWVACLAFQVLAWSQILVDQQMLQLEGG
jgi:hypothetical protein